MQAILYKEAIIEEWQCCDLLEIALFHVKQCFEAAKLSYFSTFLLFLPVNRIFYIKNASKRRTHSTHLFFHSFLFAGRNVSRETLEAARNRPLYAVSNRIYYMRDSGCAF